MQSPLAWKWILEKLVGNKSVGKPILKGLSGYVNDIEEPQCQQLLRRLALRYLEESIANERLDSSIIPLIKAASEVDAVDSRVPASQRSRDKKLLLRVKTEAVLSWIRKEAEGDVADWNRFAETLDEVFSSDELDSEACSQREELRTAFASKDEKVVAKHPVLRLRKDLLHFIKQKKASIDQPVLDQIAQSYFDESLQKKSHISAESQTGNDGGDVHVKHKTRCQAPVSDIVNHAKEQLEIRQTDDRLPPTAGVKGLDMVSLTTYRQKDGTDQPAECLFAKRACPFDDDDDVEIIESLSCKRPKTRSIIKIKDDVVTATKGRGPCSNSVAHVVVMSCSCPDEADKSNTLVNAVGELAQQSTGPLDVASEPGGKCADVDANIRGPSGELGKGEAGECSKRCDEGANALMRCVIAGESVNLEDDEVEEMEKVVQMQRQHFRQTGQEQVCCVCGDDGNLLTCNSCPIAMHVDCIGSGLSTMGVGDGLFCPFCMSKKALQTVLDAKKAARLAHKQFEETKKILVQLHGGLRKKHETMDNANKSQEQQVDRRSGKGKHSTQDHPGTNVNKVEAISGQQDCLFAQPSTRAPVENFVAPLQEGEQHDVLTVTGQGDHSAPKAPPDVSKSQGGPNRIILVPQTECRNSEIFKGEVDGERHDGDVEQSSRPMKPNQKLSSGRRAIPGLRRKALAWTAQEEEALKEGVMKYSNDGGKWGFQWQRILESGFGVFDPSRTGVDLKDKWRNMQRDTIRKIWDKNGICFCVKTLLEGICW